MPMSSRRPVPRNMAHEYTALSAPPDGDDPSGPTHDHGAPPYERHLTLHTSSNPPPPIWSQYPSQIDPYAGRDTLAPPESIANGQPRLPLFEAALARARRDSHRPSSMPERLPAMQPLPSYAPPPDPNHPDLMVGLQQSQTFRLAMTTAPPISHRALSRSPSPVVEQGGRGHSADHFLGHMAFEQDVPIITTSQDEHMWDHRLDTLGLLDGDQGDLALPPFRGRALDESIGMSSPASEKAPIADGYDIRPEPDLAPSTTQHFGPAPIGRVGRRTHNAAGGRRIRHTATLDENGFFAVDMPIPTRLAQFLPFKGVEEQKCTR